MRPAAGTVSLSAMPGALLSSRPARGEGPRALALALALALHLPLIALALVGPVGGRWAGTIPDEPTEPTFLLLLPRTDAGRQASAATARRRIEARPLAATPARAGPRLTPAGATSPETPADASAVAAPDAGDPLVTGLSPLSPAARFAPRAGPLLEAPTAPLAPTRAEATTARIRRRIAPLSDSAAATAHRRGWTLGGREGDAWGFTAEGRPRLGPVRMPQPLKAEFSRPPGRRDEFTREQANLEDLRRSVLRSPVRRVLKERAKAIRKRKESESGQPH